MFNLKYAKKEREKLKKKKKGKKKNKNKEGGRTHREKHSRGN